MTTRERFGWPGWPRGLRLEEAAAYVGLPPGVFQKGVEKRIWPHPTRHEYYLVWDRLTLDRAMDALSLSEPQEPPELDTIRQAQGAPVPTIRRRQKDQPATPPMLRDRDTVALVIENLRRDNERRNLRFTVILAGYGVLGVV